jgi:RNA-directed DNA polymerase
MIEQTVMQVLQNSWDNTLFESSYGFHPGRSAHQAVARAQRHVAAGYHWMVDLDLEKFFDRVNHDRPMGQIAKRVHDKRLLRLIRNWLKAGVLENGLAVVPRFLNGTLTIQRTASLGRHISHFSADFRLV